MNEKELSLKIKDYLNRSSLDFKFKFIDDFCDIADEHHKIYIEVKPDHFAPAQLLHAIARKEIKDAKFLGVADNRVVKLYTPPSFEKIYSFATSFDPKLVFAPSQVDKPELNEQANTILGKPEREIKLEFPTTEYFYITQDNIKSIKPIIDKYRIELDHLVNWLDGVGETDSIKVNNDGWLINLDRPEIFTNETEDEKKKKELREGEEKIPLLLPFGFRLRSLFLWSRFGYLGLLSVQLAQYFIKARFLLASCLRVFFSEIALHRIHVISKSCHLLFQSLGTCFMRFSEVCKILRN